MYLISAREYRQFVTIRDELLEAGKISKPDEAVFVSWNRHDRQDKLKGRRGFKQSQLIGQFSNEELFDLCLPEDPGDAVESIVDALVYSGQRKHKTTKHIGDLVKWENRAKRRLAKEAKKYGKDIDVILSDIAARIESAADEEE